MSPPVAAVAAPSPAPPTCECGCGGQPKTKGARFIRGHFPPRTHRTTSICATCRQPFEHRADRRRIHCSKPCYATDQRGDLSPETELAVFLFDQWRNSGLSISAHARTLGIGKDSLTWLIGNRLPARKTYGRLKRAFGDALPPSQTETEAQRLNRARVHEQLPKPGSKRSSEMYRRAAAAKRGRPRRPEDAARSAATARATGAAEQAGVRLTTDARSTEGRIRRMLFGRLRHVPRPSRPQVREWARDAADGANRSAADVLAAWTPYLEARGLWSKAGRKANETRHAIVLELRAEWRQTPKGNPKRGFWAAVAATISEVENYPVTAKEMREWYRQHLRHCMGLPQGAA